MKFLLVSLFAIVASVSALRGGPVKETPRLTPPDASCFKKANTVDVCEQEASSDGTGNCVWCQTKGDDGICISRANARDVVEIMRIPCPNYTDPREDSIVDVAATRTTALPTPPDFSCFHSMWDGENAKITCGESRAKDDSPCVWCSAGGGDHDDAAGACLSNDEAIMVNGKYGLTCPSMDYLYPAEDVIRTGIPDVNCFKAAWVADDAETACGGSKDASGNDCVWCRTSGDVAGVCLSRPESSMADGQFGLTCPGSELLERVSFEKFMTMQQ
ncbi:hypothetical protein ACHAW5_006156 [Stephanodiscus triporus]|uniref:PSI domain-containing protein n=1 Tax=Stephanodiscus triporus TaxID=2934178 RepID=A0ABD3N7Z6_9STRA